MPADNYYVDADAARDVAGIQSSGGDALDRVYIERWVRDLDLDDEWKAAQSTPI